MSNIISKKIQEARSKPIGIVATKVSKANFFDKLETFGTAIANRSYSIRIKKKQKKFFDFLTNAEKGGFHF